MQALSLSQTQNQLRHNSLTLIVWICTTWSDGCHLTGGLIFTPVSVSVPIAAILVIVISIVRLIGIACMDHLYVCMHPLGWGTREERGWVYSWTQIWLLLHLGGQSKFWPACISWMVCPSLPLSLLYSAFIILIKHFHCYYYIIFTSDVYLLLALLTTRQLYPIIVRWIPLWILMIITPMTPNRRMMVTNTIASMGLPAPTPLLKHEYAWNWTHVMCKVVAERKDTSREQTGCMLAQ